MADPSASPDFLAKVIIVGDSGVGKTNLLTKYCDNGFEDAYVATIGIDFKLKMVKVDHTNIKLQIWDTAGQERFRNITQAYFRGANAIILAYEINNRKSFNSINTWIKQIKMNSEQEFIKVLIGTKIDLQSQREVQTIEGKQLAYKHDMIFEEVSAKSGINVEEAFSLMARQIKNRRTQRLLEETGILLRSGSSKMRKKCSC